MGSYSAEHQLLNRPATPFSTSRKVLQSYDLFPKQPIFLIFLLEKYGIYKSKLCGLGFESVGVLTQNHGSYAKATPEFRNFGFALPDNRQWSYYSYSQSCRLVVCEA